MYIPTSWKEITYDQYLKLVEIENTDKPLYKIVAERLSVLTDKPAEYFLQLPDMVFKSYGSQINFLNVPIEESSNEFEIDGVKYIIPNRFEFLAAGQFVDADEHIKMYGKHKAIPYLLAIVVQDFTKYDTKASIAALDLAEKVKLLDMETLLKLSNFFLSIEKNSLTDSLNSIVQQKVEETKNQVLNYKDTLRTTGGFRSFWKRLLLVILLKWMKLHLKRLGL